MDQTGTELREGQRVQVDVSGIDAPGGLGGDTSLATGTVSAIEKEREMVRVRLDDGQEITVTATRVSQLQ